MTAILILGVGLQIGLLLTVAAAVQHAALRAGQRPVRWVWFGAIVAIALLSLAAPFRQAPWSPPATLIITTGSALPLPAPSHFDVLTVLRLIYDSVMAPISAISTLLNAAVASIPEPLRQRLPAVVIGGWGLASLLTLVSFATSYRRMRRLVVASPSQTLADTPVHVADRLGPAVVGLLPATIVVPGWLLARPNNEQALVIAHEREHITAGDPWLLIVGCAAVVLFPWNPALWVALNRLRLAIEIDCDQRVLRRGIATGSYGALLIDLCARDPGATNASYPLTAFAHRGSFLERRLRAMTDRPAPFRRTRLWTGTALAAVALLAACESKLPTAAEVSALDAKGMEARTSAFLTAPGTDSARIVYIVDGRPISGTLARAIAADSIAELKIIRGNGLAADSNVMVITTRGRSATMKGDSGTLVITARGRAGGTDSSMTVVTTTGRPSGAKKVVGIEIRATDSTAGTSRNITAPQTVVGMKLVPNGTGTPAPAFTGLLLVDGVASDPALLKTLSPDRIASINVIKGPAATTKYSDPRAANGVIEVTTKKP